MATLEQEGFNLSPAPFCVFHVMTWTYPLRALVPSQSPKTQYKRWESDTLNSKGVNVLVRILDLNQLKVLCVADLAV